MSDVGDPVAVDEFIAGAHFPLCEVCAGEFDQSDLRNGICADCEEQIGADL